MATLNASNVEILAATYPEGEYTTYGMKIAEGLSPTSANEIFNTIINKIGKTVINTTNVYDPFAVFNKGTLEYGQTVENVWTGLVESAGYDGEDTDAQWKQKYVEAKASYHPIDLRTKYQHSVSRNRLMTAFHDERGLANLVNDIMGKPAASARRDHFLLIKSLLVDNAEKLKTVSIAGKTVNEISKTIQKVSNDFTFLSDAYNLAGVETDCPKDRQYLITTSEFDAELNHEVLATAFNMDKVEWLGHRILIDTFSPRNTESDSKRLDNMASSLCATDTSEIGGATASEKAKNWKAVLVDAEFFVDYVTVDEMATNYNAGTLTENFFYHVWRILSVNPFRNCAVFTA